TASICKERFLYVRGFAPYQPLVINNRVWARSGLQEASGVAVQKIVSWYSVPCLNQVQRTRCRRFTTWVLNTFRVPPTMSATPTFGARFRIRYSFAVAFGDGRTSGMQGFRRK